jgi:hypothetical protein
MQIEAINTQQDYEDFCDFIESGAYKKLDINAPYVIADSIKFIIAKQFSFVFEDIVAYVTGTPKAVVKENPIGMRSPISTKPRSKAKVTEKVELIPKNVVTVSGIPFNIY